METLGMIAIAMVVVGVGCYIHYLHNKLEVADEIIGALVTKLYADQFDQHEQECDK